MEKCYQFFLANFPPYVANLATLHHALQTRLENNILMILEWVNY